MGKPFDVSKFRKNITKSIDGISTGFNDPTDWISTGNHALNYLISGDFNKGIPLGKVTVFAGESGCLPETAMVKVRVNNEIQSVTVGRLNELMHDTTINLVEIDTPDDFQEVTEWFDKGVLPMVRVTTDDHVTECATNHLLQTSDEGWTLASDVQVGELLLTETGHSLVTNVEEITSIQCYDFTVNHDNHRYWGDGFSSHNSGKSYICSGNIVKDAQRQGIYVVLIDTENALDEAWLHALGVDTSEDKLLKISMSMIDDVAKTISTFMKDYRDMAEEDRPKVLFIIDSLGMLLTPTDVTQFDKGDMKGDLGRKPKALTALVRNTVNMLGNHNVGLVATNHTYESQDMFNPDEIISGGRGFIFASSIVVAMKKMKLKEDESGNKTSAVNGIRAGCKVVKTRYAKPFEGVQLKIPYKEGMNIYSGLFDLMEDKGLVTKTGNRYSYKTLSGEEILLFRKAWERNENGCLDKVMTDMEARDETTPDAFVETDAEDELEEITTE